MADDSIPADFLPEQVETTLHMELLPGNVLGRDIRELAGILDFTADEINYICMHRAPFKFLLDQWCKRDRSKATLQSLHEALMEVPRADLAELVQNTIKDLRKSDFKDFEVLATLQYEREKRRDEDCTFEPANDQSYTQEEGEGDGRLPYVYVVYYPENEQHVSSIVDLVNQLRQQQIDAHAAALESELAHDRQYYVFSNLQKADLVLVVCSSTVKQIEVKMNSSQIETMSDASKEISFALKFIVNDVYRRKSINAKYVPVFVSERSLSNIPQILRTPKSYVVPSEFDELVRRVFQVPNYELPKIKKNKFQPVYISA